MVKALQLSLILVIDDRTVHAVNSVKLNLVVRCVWNSDENVLCGDETWFVTLVMNRHV
jgi:hypothetical protein